MMPAPSSMPFLLAEAAVIALALFGTLAILFVILPRLVQACWIASRAWFPEHETYRLQAWKRKVNR